MGIRSRKSCSDFQRRPCWKICKQKVQIKIKEYLCHPRPSGPGGTSIKSRTQPLTPPPSSTRGCGLHFDRKSVLRPKSERFRDSAAWLFRRENFRKSVNKSRKSAGLGIFWRKVAHNLSPSVKGCREGQGLLECSAAWLNSAFQHLKLN